LLGDPAFKCRVGDIAWWIQIGHRTFGESDGWQITYSGTRLRSIKGQPLRS